MEEFKKDFDKFENENSDHYVERWEAGKEYDDVFEVFKWKKTVPYIQFPEVWEVKIIPSFGGAIIRFQVRLPYMTDEESVSVYLDGYNMIGSMSGPYWECFPIERVAVRFDIESVDMMLKVIQNEFDRRTESQEQKRLARSIIDRNKTILKKLVG